MNKFRKKVFIDIGHPAHVHYFRNLIQILKQKGVDFIITARDKDIAHKLLDLYEIEYINRGKGRDSLLGKILYLLKANFKLLRIAIKEKPDLFLSFGSPYAAQVSSLVRKPCITLDDTESAKFGQLFYKPFSNLILSPSTFYKDFGAKHIKFNGYLELCYLHPKYFKPDEAVLNYLNVKKGEKYSLLRFVKWRANHDIGHKGIDYNNKLKAVKEFEKFGKVFISSEIPLDGELKKYSINISADKIHSVLNYASLFYGESATMASEAAILGTPAIYLDNEGRGYTDEEENKYGIVYNFSESYKDQISSINKGIEILKNFSSDYWNKKRERILEEKIDVTSFLIWLIEKYPKSLEIIKNNPDYQYDFK